MSRTGIIPVALIFAGLLLISGCQRIQEPWVRGDNQLQQERARSDAVRQELRHRLLRVQTDR